jgi:hypothetical protein
MAVTENRDCFFYTRINEKDAGLSDFNKQNPLFLVFININNSKINKDTGQKPFINRTACSLDL